MASHVQRVPAVIKGHRHFSYGGATLPESVTIEQYYDLTPTKKSNLRMTDELLPKPTEINIGEKVIKVSIPKEHPYRSHISSCALFPTYHCPDDPQMSVRTVSEQTNFPNIPASATRVTVLSKTKGAPFRHELCEVSMATSGHTTSWSGQNDVQNHTKQVKGESQVFYPTPPNLTLQEENTTLSERTTNMLSNLEKVQWLTSNQLDYTGTGPTNPIQIDDFNKKKNSLIASELNPHKAQLRERSHPTFLPSRPLEGRKARILQNRHHLESQYPCQPHHMLRHSAESNRTPNVCEMCWERNCLCSYKSDVTKPAEPKNEAKNRELEPFFKHTFQSVYQENEEGHLTNSRTQNYTAGKNHFGLYQPSPPSVEGTDQLVGLKRLMMESEEKGKFREVHYIVPPIQPRPLSYHSGVGTSSTVLRTGPVFSQSLLLELQNSFSRTEAYRRFHDSRQSSSVDLRDNIHSGKKHSFYGFNSYYFRN